MSKMRQTAGSGVATGLIVVLCLAGALHWSVNGADSARSQRQERESRENRSPGDEQLKRAAGGLRLQLLDEPLKKLEPRKPRTEGQLKRVDAIAWYMAGQLKQAKGDEKGALEAYRKAAELDPDAVEVYQTLVPLEFTEGDAERAVQYALKAVELDPDDFRLLHQLGRHMALRGKPDEALELLEKATQSSELKKESGANVILHSHLAILYSATGQKQKAAGAYAVVFDALVDPQKYNLDFHTRAALLNDENTSYERIGQAFLEADRPQLAVKAFERAAEARRGKPGSLSYNLARVYLQTEQHEKALAELQKYLDAQLQTKGRDAYKLLAEILEGLDKSDELIPRLQQLAEKDSHNTTLRGFLAEQFLAQDRLDDAELLLKRIVEESNDPEGYLGLAAVYRRKSLPAEWLHALARVFEQGQQLDRVEGEIDATAENETFLDDVIAAGRKAAQSDEPKLKFADSYILGKLALTGKRTDGAIEFYKLAIEQTRDRRSVLMYSELGEYLLLDGHFAEAAKLYEQAAKDPEMRGARPNFLFRLAQAHEFNGNTKDALRAVDEAKKLRPDLALLHYQEAWIYYHSRQWEKAVPLFEKVISDHPEDKESVRRSQLSLSNIYVQRGELGKGEEILEQILAEEPNDPSVNNDLGYLYADQGKNLEQAEAMIRKALEAEPENPAYLDSMGWVLFKRDRFEEALPHLEKAVQKPSGSDPTILEHLGDCYSRLGQTDKAVEAWQRGLEKARQETHLDQEHIERIQQKITDAMPTNKPAETESTDAE